jgi:hypothetical protein
LGGFGHCTPLVARRDLRRREESGWHFETDLTVSGFSHRTLREQSPQQRMPPRLGVVDRMPHFMGRIMGAETLVTSGKFSLLIKSES